MMLAAEDVLSVVSYALADHFRGEGQEAWHPHRFGSAQPPDNATIEERLRGYQMVDSDQQIDGHLENSRDALLFGAVGAGKTTAATWHASRWAQAGQGLVWLDLTDPEDNDESVAYALLAMRRVQRVLVVVENVQANLSVARAIVDLVRQIRTSLGISVVVLATGSPSVAREELKLGLTPVPANGYALVQAILHGADGITADQRARIGALAEGDAVIAGIAIDLLRTDGTLPEAGMFADLVAEWFHVDTLGPQARLLLYKLACMALFEIEINRREIAAGEHAALEELRAARLVQPNDESYTIGARSLGKLFVQHAHHAWTDAGPLKPPDRVAYEYLQQAGAAQIKAMLDRLDLLPVNSQAAQAHTGLASVWGALRFLAESLARRVMDDPTWGDEAASAAFASLALIDLNRPDAWRRSVEFVRSRWSYDNGAELPKWVGETASADLVVFERMRDLMAAEHSLIAADTIGDSEPFEPLDAEQACRTWMLGILLSLEAKAPDRDQARLDRLIQIAQAVSEGGAFYPREAPWVTAQVVLGLCLAGRNIYTDATVKEACSWLCLEKKLGGAYSNGWQNGLSGKTSDVITTALCLSALLHAGWQQNTVHVTTAYQNLSTEQELLEPNGRETELALIVEARLRNGDEWEELSSATLSLLGWAIQSGRSVVDRNIKATRPGDPLSASAKAPFIATQLWIIIWTAVKRELRQLLHEIQGLDHLLSSDDPDIVSDNGQDAVEGDDAGRNEEADAPVAPAVPVRAIRRAMDRLRREIEENISTRARQMPNLRDSVQEPFERSMEVWQERLRSCELLDNEIESGNVTLEVIDNLNSLGREIFTVGWQEIDGASS